MKESKETLKNRILYYLERIKYLESINKQYHDYDKTIKQYKDKIIQIVKRDF